jgi:hypothetical protein
VIRFTKEAIKDVKYVVVEAALRRDKSNKVEGLFIGYQPMVKTHTQLVSNDEQFIWLYRGDNIYMLNAAHYDVGSIEMQKGAEVSTYIGTSQEEYINRLKLIHEVFTEEKKVLASGLIDADVYTVPKKVEDHLNEGEKKSINAKTPRPDYTSPSYNTRSGACNYSTGSYYKKKEPSTTVFKRTSKYPITTAIDKMRAKVEEIRRGEYKAPELPLIPADEEVPVEEADNKTSTTQDDYEDIYGGVI